MSDKIKSAWEKAMERFDDKNRQVSEEDLTNMEFRFEAQKLAGRFLKESNFKLNDLLNEYTGEKRKAVCRVVEETFLNRLVLPENENIKEENHRVMEGLLQIKQDAGMIKSILQEIELMFDQYIQARNQSYEKLKQDFTYRFNNALKKMNQQSNLSMDPEKHPRFKEEWLKLAGKVNEKFMPDFENLIEKIKEVK
ncbi:MAG: hypothetical protein K9L17_05275 [Clostridiales bacterium]|nr:hypothetical protein [Clostridiales bacterium]MCF8022082.1 hypothetical protein [Clostridiales bacterium]